jgi:hypothetical protein
MRLFRYWANWHVNQKRARCANASCPGRASEPGAVRPNLGQRKHTGASRPARRLGARLEEQETSAVERAETNTTWRCAQIAALGSTLASDELALSPTRSRTAPNIAPSEYLQTLRHLQALPAAIWWGRPDAR